MPRTIPEWSGRFAAQAGWNVGPLEGDPRASARPSLIRGDGGHSRGLSCPVRPPAEPRSRLPACCRRRRRRHIAVLESAAAYRRGVEQP